MSNNVDYEFKWWDESYNDQYVTSDETLVAHSNKKLGVINSPYTSLKHYLYCNPEIVSMDNVFYAMDVRRANLKQTISQAIKPSYTAKQRAYIEWYYITRGLPIAAHPSEEVQREFDRYYALSPYYNQSHNAIKYMPDAYSKVMPYTQDELRDDATALEVADYYCLWFTHQDIPSVRTLYCHSWDGSTHICIRKQIEGSKSLKLTKYLDWCITNGIWDIDEIIQPSLDMMVRFEQYLLKTAKYNECWIGDDDDIISRNEPIHIYDDEERRLHCESAIYSTQEMYGILRFAPIYCASGLIIMDPGNLSKFTINTSRDNIRDIIDMPLDKIPDEVSYMMNTYIKRWEYNDNDNRKYLFNLLGRFINVILLVLLTRNDGNAMDRTLDVLNKTLDTISRIECYDTSRSRDPVKYLFIMHIHRAIKLIKDYQYLND